MKYKYSKYEERKAQLKNEYTLFMVEFSSFTHEDIPEGTVVEGFEDKFFADLTYFNPAKMRFYDRHIQFASASEGNAYFKKLNAELGLVKV